jgi:hypothetical protein
LWSVGAFFTFWPFFGNEKTRTPLKKAKTAQEKLELQEKKQEPH